ncbi:hypothetical protein BGX28_006938 [Mortierella sp. GBA30]|nr:hypothetical protein BGX28_006938 [Mortierella sp. GBA30]
MPVASTINIVDKEETTPHCFCFKPAVRLLTDDVGLVYECHYTDIDLWETYSLQEDDDEPEEEEEDVNKLGRRRDSQPPRSPSPEERPSIPSTHASAEAHSHIHSHSHSPCQSNQSSKDKASPAIQEIVDALKAIAGTVKNDLPGAWGTKPVAVNESTPTSKYNQTYNSDSGSRIPRVNSKHRQQQQQQPKAITDKTTTSYSFTRKQRMVICGFHMHAQDWQAFKSLIWKAELDLEKSLLFDGNGEENRECVYAQRHHEILLRHPYLHGTFLRKAYDSACRAYLVTVGRWLNWEKEVLEGKTSPLGGAPTCFCGSRMRLSSSSLPVINHRGGIRVDYYCASRLSDARHGCSRVVDASRWVGWQPPRPIHPLAHELKDQKLAGIELGLKGEIRTNSSEGGDLNTVWPPSEKQRDGQLDSGVEEWDAEPVNKTSPLHSLRRGTWDQIVDEQHGDGADDDDDDENDEDGDGEDSGYEYGAEQSHEETTPTKPFKPRLLRLPEGFEDDFRSNQGVTVRQKGGNSPEPSQEVRSERRRETYFSLTSKIRDLDKAIAPARTDIDKTFQTIEMRLTTWQGSTGRLREYAAALRLDGCDNPTLRCRVCKEGTLSRANIPCFHLAMCDKCIREHAECVVCHRTIESSQRIYWG